MGIPSCSAPTRLRLRAIAALALTWALTGCALVSPVPPEMVIAFAPELMSKPPVAKVRVPLTVKVVAAAAATVRELKVGLAPDVAVAVARTLSVSTPAAKVPVYAG